jgi:hypothetical protein
MSLAQKKVRIEKDRITQDGVRLFNPTKPHGVVYSDGFIEVKYIQEFEGREVHYRGDGTPVGYKLGAPLPPAYDEVLDENQALKQRIADLEASSLRTQELLERLLAQKEATPAGNKAPKASGIHRSKEAAPQA